MEKKLQSRLTHPCPSALAEWRLDYNTSGRTAASATLPPVDDAKLSVPASKRDGTLRAIGAPRLVPPDSAGEIQARMSSTPPAGAACGRAPMIVPLLRSPTSAPADAQAETSSQPDTRGDFRDARSLISAKRKRRRGNRRRSRGGRKDWVKILFLSATPHRYFPRGHTAKWVPAMAVHWVPLVSASCSAAPPQPCNN